MQLTKQQKDTIRAIIAAKTRVSLDLEAIRDDTAALAISLALKPSAVNKIGVIIRDMNKGGVIEEESNLLELAGQMVNGGEE